MPSRTVSVTFVNYTQDSGPLFVSGPDGRHVIGSLGYHGALTAKIPVYDEGGPVTVAWKVARSHGEFILTPDVTGPLRIDLTIAGPVGPYAMTGPVTFAR